MAEHTIQGLMNVTMDKVRQMADANTIIGKPIKTEDGTTIIPVSRISVGIGTGGSDFDSKNGSQKDLFGGGSGAGVSIRPVAFLVIKEGMVRTIQLSDPSNSIDRALTMLPELVDRLMALIPDKKAEKPDMCGWLGHRQGNLAPRVCEPQASAWFGDKFCPQEDTRGKEFLSRDCAQKWVPPGACRETRRSAGRRTRRRKLWHWNAFRRS